MPRPVAFITGASRGIGACTALELAREGYDLVLTARTLEEGEPQTYAGGSDQPQVLPGSLRQTEAQAQALGAKVLCLRSDILDFDSLRAAAAKALEVFGHIDLLFNNACYQGPGNMQRLLDVDVMQTADIYRGNVQAPLLLVQMLLPGMIKRGQGCIINMVSGSALNNPPAPADQGGWGFAYPASKAALIRMVPSLRVEHADSGVTFWNVEPGFVLNEIMKASGFDEAIAERFRPTPPEHVARVVRWLAEDPEAAEFADKTVIMAPQLYAKRFAGKASG